MTRSAPHPGFLPGEKVTLEHEIAGRLRLIVSHTEPALGPHAPFVVCTLPDGAGRYRRLATDLQRGWGN